MNLIRKIIIWRLIMIVHLEKVMFRMKKMSTNMRTGKLRYHKILFYPIYIRGSKGHLFQYTCSIGGARNSEWNITNDVIIVICCSSIFGVG
jgi:hypothetical protein